MELHETEMIAVDGKPDGTLAAEGELEGLTDPLRATGGKPPFGANGLAFNRAGTALLVTNTGDDAVIRVPVSAGHPGTPTVQGTRQFQAVP